MPIFLESKINLDGRTLRRYGPCKMQSQPPASRLPASIHTEIAKERTTTDRRVIHPNRSLRPLRSLCENPFRKGDPHGGRKDRKRTDNDGSKGHIIRIGLCDLCDLCVKIRSEKAIHTEIAKIAKGRTTTKSKGSSNPNRSLRPLRSLCENPDQKRPSTRRSQRSRRNDNSELKGHPIRIGLCDLCDLCVKIRSERPSTRRSQRSQRNRQPRIEGSSNPNRSCDFCDLCV
jgi:ferredoxin